RNVEIDRMHGGDRAEAAAQPAQSYRNVRRNHAPRRSTIPKYRNEVWYCDLSASTLQFDAENSNTGRPWRAHRIGESLAITATSWARAPNGTARPVNFFGSTTTARPFTASPPTA